MVTAPDTLFKKYFCDSGRIGYALGSAAARRAQHQDRQMMKSVWTAGKDLLAKWISLFVTFLFV